MKDKTRVVVSHITPQDKEEPLTREDVKCPICWSILMEPVTFPCTHNMCLECYRNTVQDNCFNCPCCRYRISNWSRKAERLGILVNQPFWKKIQEQFPKFVQARLTGLDSQEIRDEDLEYDSSGDNSCSDTHVESDPDRVVSPGKLRVELDELYENHDEGMKSQNKVEAEALATADLIRKLKAVDGFATQQVIFVEDPAEEVEVDPRKEVKVKGGEKSPQKNSPGKSLCRNLFSEWETGSTVEVVTTPEKVASPKAKGRRSSWHVASAIGQKKINWKDGPPFLATLSTSQPNNNNSAIRQRILQEKVLSSSSATASGMTTNCSTAVASSDLGIDSPLKKTTSSFVPVYSPRMATGTELPSKSVNGATRLSLDSKTAEAKSKIEHIKRSHQAHTSSDTPDSINFEVNSYFRPIRSAPKTPPKQLPDGSYLPEPRLVKSTPIRLGSAPPALMLLPSGLPTTSATATTVTAISSKKITSTKPKLVDYDEDTSSDTNSLRSSAHSALFSPPPPILVHYALQGVSPSEFTCTAAEGRRTEPPPELDAYSPVNNDEEALAKKRQISDLMYRKVQAFQLEQFRKRKLQEDQDREYAKKLQRVLNRPNSSASRTRDSDERYEIRNWVSPSPPSLPSSSNSLPSTNVPVTKYPTRSQRITKQTTTTSEKKSSSKRVTNNNNNNKNSNSTKTTAKNVVAVKNGNSQGLSKRCSTNNTKTRVEAEPQRRSTRVTRSQSQRGNTK